MKMTTRIIVDICNSSDCVDCIIERYCQAYFRKYKYSPTNKNEREIRETLNMPDSAYSESEVIKL